ncbi:MAG TPA: hypothetical protein VFT55_06085 [Planctomycetota bacterium]|nr:hypothetical protein [Planctomycetota bacterium]
MRIMCLYDSSHFTAAPTPVTAPILITELKWRANDSTTSWSGGTYNNATVRLATAAVDYASATTTWASNVGPDVTTVYTGPVTVNGGTGAGAGVPGPFHVTITLTTPFLYDPYSGDLVVDTEHVPSNFTGGSTTTLDVHIPGVNAKRVYSSTFYPAANGVDDNCDVMEIGYVPASGTAATNLILGQGCIRSNTTFYEHFATSAGFDLDNSVLSMFPIGPGSYLVIGGAGSLLPVGSIATPVTLALGNDAAVTQLFTTGTFPGATSFTICSNGFVSTASNGTSPTPDVNAHLNAANTAWRSWHDFNPSAPAGGQVKYEESATAIVVTWDGVWDTFGTSPANANTMQMQFYPSGQVTFAWGTMSDLGNGHLVGYSPGGSSLDPGNTDLSTLGTNFIMLGPDILPLALAPMSRPALGANWNLTTSRIPATGVIGVDIFGIADPGVLDLFFLGMPGCQLRTTLDVINAWPVGGTTHNYSFAVPALPTSLIGFEMFTQSAVFQVPPMNAFGAITSNGIKGTLGDV